MKLTTEVAEIDMVKKEFSLLKKRFEELDVDNLHKDLADAKAKLVMVVMELDEKKRDLRDM